MTSTRRYQRTSLAVAALTLLAALIITSLLLGQRRLAPAANAAARAVGTVDTDDLLVLRFDNSLNGEQGETPTQATGHSFQAGVTNQGVLLPNPNQLFYQSANNISATEGTLECWVKPTWNGNDGQHHYILQYGAGGGIIIGKDSANNLRLILNRFGVHPGGEVGVAFNVNAWQANQWHHLAFTWSNSAKQLAIYIDGTLSKQTSFTTNLLALSSMTLQIGGDGAGRYIQAVVDNLRISNRARTAQEIAQRYLSALTVTSLTVAPESLHQFPNWFWSPRLTAVTNLGTLTVPAAGASWTSSNSAVATVDATGRINSLAPGDATLIASIQGAQDTLNLLVKTPLLAPEVVQSPPALATPAANSLYEVPVVVFRFLPTADGVNIDPAYDADFYSLNSIPLSEMKNNIDRFDQRIKFMLEEGSRFRGYNNPAAQPTLGYKVVAYITVYEPTPPGRALGMENGFPLYEIDYQQLFARFNVRHYIENLGVKEVWVWHGNIAPGFPSYDPNLHRPENFRAGWESNMSSPTGDISNSNRDNSDLPVYNKTYVVYGQNNRRTQAEAIHNHGHQLEAILSHINQRQDGNTTLWWQLFAKPVMTGANPPARCGNTHFPPNATRDYDYTNLNLVASDIMNWQPSGGPTTMVNANTWGNVPYAWPGGTAPPQEVESKWYIFWFQSMAGRDNAIPYNANKLTNWWHFTGDWDAAIQGGLGLHEPGGCNYGLSVTNQAFNSSGGTGTVNVTCAGGCKWIASSNEPWITITGGRTGNGNGTVTLAVAANAGTPRTGTVAIAGQVFTVMQNSGGLMFYPLARPVRLLDTRAGETACYTPNMPIQGGTARLQPARGLCAGLTIPANAAAITGNITSVQSGGGYLTLYPSDATQPTVAATNYNPNEIVNNVFTVGLGAADGAFNIFALNTTEVVVDVTGYYAPPGPGGLYFHPLPAPVRLLETRAGQPVGCVKPGAPLAGGADSLQTATTACTGIPASARALVGNATTVSPQGPGYLTLFPAEAARPLIASSNYDINQIVNGPFTTGLSAEGGFKVFTLATTELVIDVLGYYSAEATDANGAGLLFTPLARPVRWLETRAGQAVGCYKPGAPLNGNQTYAQAARGTCDGQTIPAAALAVVGNATVVSPATGGYVTLWPSSAVQPTVATVNYNGGEIVNRHFIVGLGNADGAFKMFSFATTDLVIDLSGYFAP